MPYFNHIKILVNIINPTKKKVITSIGVSKRIPHNAIKKAEHNIMLHAILLNFY